MRPIWGRPMAALYTRPNIFTLGRASNTITLGRALEARPKVSSEAAFKTRPWHSQVECEGGGVYIGGG